MDKKNLKLENVTVEELGFGRYYMYNDVIPCIEITNAEGKVKGYLSAFRDYKFQVSGTWDGQSDLGSTPVFGLQTFGKIIQDGRSNLSQESTVKYFISVIANDAILDYARSRTAMRYDDEFEAKKMYIVNKSYRYGTWNADPEFEKFVDACYLRYVVNVDSIPGSPYYDPQLEQVVDKIAKIG